MAKQRQKKRNKGLGAGGIVALVIAGLVLIGILAGVIWYVHSGRVGMGQSAGIITAEQTTVLEKTTSKDVVSDEGDGSAKTSKDKSKTTAKAADEGKSENATSADRKEASTPKDSAAGSSAVTFKSKTTAKTLGKYYTADTDAFRKAYDGKTVTVSDTISDKSAKMLYVELETGKKVPLRVYLSSEEQREQFNKFAKGDTITVKGSVGVLYPMDVDSGGFQEMADGLIALDSVSLVK